MLRILHCIYDDPGNPWVGGGGAVRVFELYRRLTGDLASVTVATGAYPGARDVELEGIRYLRLGLPRPYAWSRLTYAVAAARLLDRGDYDAGVFDFSTYLPLWLPPGRPCGLTVHHITGVGAIERWGSVAGRAIRRQEEWRLRRARVWSATSEATEHQLRAILGSAAAVHRVGAGVPDELFELPRRGSEYLLYFGRLDRFQKGLDTLLEAVAILTRGRPELVLKVAGRGQDAVWVEAQARALGIGDRVELLGPVGDRARNELFSRATVLLMPSRFEGFGMVAAEAMAAGVPVVGSRAGSLPEVVAPPAGGILVPPGDAVALAAATERLLREEAERERMGRSARESAAARFRWSRVAEQHLEFLKAIGSAGSGPDTTTTAR